MKGFLLGLLAVTMTFTVPKNNDNGACMEGVPSTDAEWVTVYGRPMAYPAAMELARVNVRGRAGLKNTLRIDLPRLPGAPRWWQFSVTTTDTAGNVSCRSNYFWTADWENLDGYNR